MSTFQKSLMGCLNWQLLPKIEVFYRPEWTKWGTKSKWILTIFKYKIECYKQSVKNRWKKWGHLSSFHVSFLSYGFKLSKNGIFNNFVLTSAKNLSLLKQFTYMHLKGLITLFQKMLWFIGVWATVHEKLTIKISKKMLT